MEVKDYWPNDQLQFTKYISNEGEVQERYYQNGQMKFKHVYRNGKPYGEQKGWWSNGKKKYVGNYNKYGKEEGAYTKYDSSGKVVERMNYR